MNYRHAYHAGNFADVVKHVALVALLTHLKKKDKPFRAIDSHAGPGLYKLDSGEAARTGEAREGIARLGDLSAQPGLPQSLATYLKCVRAEGEGRYPGSPRLAARLLRPLDRLVAIEKHAGEAAALRASLAPFGNARALVADGYARLPALLPPPERRGLVLIDPPYESDSEFARVANVVRDALRRFATGIYLVWFPIKSKSEADAFCGEVLAGGLAEALRIDIDVGRDVRGDKERLAAAGLLVGNPPFGFEDEMRAASGLLAPRLGRTSQSPANIALTRLGAR